MKTRFALIVLGLVIFPTAVLSLLAGLALTEWESVLQRRLQITAAHAIQEASSQIRARLEDNLEHLRLAAAEALSRGGNLADLDMVAVRLHNHHPLIEQIYVYMTPVGIIYPTSSPPGNRRSAPGKSPVSMTEERLAQRIQQALAQRPSLTDTISFVHEDRLYWFTYLRNRQGLYAGFRVSPEAFDRLLTQTLALLSAGGFILSAAGPTAGTEDIRISDSFSPVPPSSPSPTRPSSRRVPTGSSVLARGRLRDPLGFVEVTAFLDEADAPTHASPFPRRLYAWGILLATGCVVTGTILMVRSAASEIRRARERSDFVTSVSHDLRTPVASLKMLAESLHLGHVQDRGKQQQFLATLVRECDGLADTIERLLYFVRQDQGAATYARERLDPGVLVRSAVDTMAARLDLTVQRAEEQADAAPADAARGAIRLTLADPLPQVCGDWGALTRVLTNLLDNAAKYGRSAENPSAPLRIHVEAHPSCRRGRPGVAIVVEDHGIGIEKREVRLIFRRFYRGRASTLCRVSGAGLGLALCRDIVRAHGGRILASSQPGRGSRFTVWLPALRS